MPLTGRPPRDASHSLPSPQPRSLSLVAAVAARVFNLDGLHVPRAPLSAIPRSGAGSASFRMLSEPERDHVPGSDEGDITICKDKDAREVV